MKDLRPSCMTRDKICSLDSMINSIINILNIMRDCEPPPERTAETLEIQGAFGRIAATLPCRIGNIALLYRLLSTMHSLVDVIWISQSLTPSLITNA